MGTAFEVIISAVICAVILCMIVVMRSFLDAPAPRRGGGTVYTVIAAGSETTELGSTVEAALRLRATGAMRSNIIIADLGMSESCRREAEILAGGSGVIYVCPPEALGRIIGESEWTANESS